MSALFKWLFTNEHPITNQPGHPKTSSSPEEAFATRVHSAARIKGGEPKRCFNCLYYAERVQQWTLSHAPRKHAYCMAMVGLTGDSGSMLPVNEMRSHGACGIEGKLYNDSEDYTVERTSSPGIGVDEVYLRYPVKKSPKNDAP